MQIPGRVILISVAVVGWSVAILMATLFVARLGFLGIGIMGLSVWFICIRVELEKEAAVGSTFSMNLYAQQIAAREGHSRADHVARRHEHSVLVQSMRFFKHLGIGMTVIGFVGFVQFQM